MIRQHLFLLFIRLLACQPLQPNYTLRVCQHKTCTKQHNSVHRSLAQMFRDLIPPDANDEPTGQSISIEASACLTQCGRGPNMSILITKSPLKEQEVLYNGVNSPQAAALVLDVACGISVPPILLAACDVMSKAEHEADASKREVLLNSVISALSSSGFKESHALSSALAMRADARMALSPPSYQGAVDDATIATRIAPFSNDIAWRILAEAHEGLGDYLSAIQTLNKWSCANNAFATKAAREIQRIALICSETTI